MKRRLMNVFVLLVVLGQVVPLGATEYSYTSYAVRDGLSAEVMAKAGYAKNSRLETFLKNHGFPLKPSVTDFERLIGSPPEDYPRIDGVKWGDRDKWDHKRPVGFHTAIVSNSGGWESQLVKTVIEVGEGDKTLRPADYGRLYDRFGPTVDVFQAANYHRKRGEGYKRVSPQSYGEIDLVSYDINYGGVPVRVEFVIESRYMSVRVCYVATVSVATELKKKDRMDELLK